jgi:nicotinamidase-related amidase
MTISGMRWMRAGIAAASLMIGAGGLPASAADVIEQWDQAGTLAAPALKPVTVTGKETALILLDFSQGVCNMEKRPRCFQTLPKVAAVLKQARASGATVIYSLLRGAGLEVIPKEIAANPGELSVPSFGADKFYGTDLEEMLKKRGIKNLVLVGTSAQGAVLFTSGGAALRDYNVVVPVDTASSEDLYGEVAGIWVLANGPNSVSGKVTLTRSDMLRF